MDGASGSAGVAEVDFISLPKARPRAIGPPVGLQWGQPSLPEPIKSTLASTSAREAPPPHPHPRLAPQPWAPRCRRSLRPARR
ncbi:hypothetical protein EYF80_041093 [Liparis tanakae]|uniref:Uncharacterized protein n=1 Tax=Liparis tanakae TaxID=230148 RepID=A0A4Z2G6L2_9TELE|nr:hypothetical protein EYF80_041093 [Liparis tanakae]